MLLTFVNSCKNCSIILKRKLENKFVPEDTQSVTKAKEENDKEEDVFPASRDIVEIELDEDVSGE